MGAGQPSVARRSSVGSRTPDEANPSQAVLAAEVNSGSEAHDRAGGILRRAEATRR
jgi:hypothetical protein